MEKVTPSFLFIFLVILGVSCGKSKSLHVVSGIVMDATMNNIMLITAKGDTIDISTMNADRSKVPGVLIGDSVKIAYEKEAEGGIEVLNALDLSITKHSPYCYIQGAWVEPNPINAKEVQGFILNKDGTASSVNMATLVFESWTLDDNVLILGYKSMGNGLTLEGADTLNVVKLNADSLVLSQNNAIIWRLFRTRI